MKPFGDRPSLGRVALRVVGEPQQFKKRVEVQDTLTVSGGVIQPPTYTDATRPTANMQVGAMIYNTGDNAPNFWDGTNWRDAASVIT